VPDTAALDSAFAFAGREWDDEAGLYYNRARYYDPLTARFLGDSRTGTPILTAGRSVDVISNVKAGYVTSLGTRLVARTLLGGWVSPDVTLSRSEK
jgi:RHS repeat-associated protein